MNNKRKFFTTLLCVATLTTGLLISGCSVNKVSNLGSAVSSVVGDNDEKAAAKLNTLIEQLTSSIAIMRHLLNSKQTVWLN